MCKATMVEYSSANLIRLVYSRYKHVRANTIGAVNVHTSYIEYAKGNWSLPIGQNSQRFAYSSRQSPFYKAVATGNGN